MTYIIYGVLILIGLIFLSGIRIVNPDKRAAITRLGKYMRPANEGFNWIIPLIDGTDYQDITEQMMDVESFEAITKERLNTKIDLVVFYKVREDADSIRKSLYKVSNFEKQVVRIAQTTARNIIGTMPFEKVNSERNIINNKLRETLAKQSSAWGVDIVRIETKEITPPTRVQDSMNEVLMAENKKTAATNLATAIETEADGRRRAVIKEAEGDKQSRILRAQGQAQANVLINKSFKGNAIKFKQLEVTQASLQDNTKIVMTEKGVKPSLILGNLTGN